MKDHITLSVSKLKALFGLLENYNTNAEAFFHSSGIDPSDLNSPESKLTYHQFIHILKKAESLLDDNEIGLHLGENVNLSSNILGYILLNCNNLGDAFEKYCMYSQLVDNGSIFEIEMKSITGHMILTFYDDTLNGEKHLVDFRLSSLVSCARFLTGKDLNLVEALFMHERPENISEYERIFQCRLEFNSSMNALIGRRKLYDVPILQPNKNLLALFEKYAQENLEKSYLINSYSNKVSRLIVERLRANAPSIDAVARRLFMSTRNLQLKLKEEGTTYSGILDKVRKELAAEYLNDQSVPISEIAYMLGFSEPSVFHRSFKRWTNQTPSSYRKKAFSI